jgi:hypothetical protein
MSMLLRHATVAYTEHVNTLRGYSADILSSNVTVCGAQSYDVVQKLKIYVEVTPHTKLQKTGQMFEKLKRNCEDRVNKSVRVFH